MKNKKGLTIFLLLVIAVVVGVYWYVQSRMQIPQDTISVSGNIEVTDVETSFRISGWVNERLVSEGEIVSKDQTIAKLDGTELGQEVSLRKAEVSAAGSTLEELETGFREEVIEEARAVVKRAKADLERLRSDYIRQKSLYKKDIISTREFESIQSGYQAAEAKHKEAYERLKLLEKGPRKEKIEKAHADLERAQEALALAKTRLDYATIKSPISGIVLSENIEPGEYVSPGTPIVTIGDLQNVWLRAYINETDLGKVKVGQKVRITTDTYPNKIYEGFISFISSRAEFTPKNVQTQEERVKLVYRIKIEVPNPKMELKPGMPADGEIILKDDYGN